MRVNRKLGAFVITGISLLMANAVLAQEEPGGDDYNVIHSEAEGEGVPPYVEYQKHIESSEEVSPLDVGLFGEQVSLYNGSTEFAVVDIDIPGNNDLPVTLARRHQVQPQPQGSIGYNSLLGYIGNWDIEIPHLVATYPRTPGWNSDRCSSGSVPPISIGPGGIFYRSEVWQGISVHVPGRSDSRLFGVQPETPLPIINTASYQYTTKNRDVLDCIPLQNGSAEEGFRMTTPAGIRYYFDYKVIRDAAPLEETREAGDGTPDVYRLSRDRYYLLATKIEDRFGNTVSFEYNDKKDGRLEEIRGSDGRLIELFYDINGQLDRAVSNGETWRYNYVDEDVGAPRRPELSEVVRPDGSKWEYQYQGSLLPNFMGPNLGQKAECRGRPQTPYYPYTITATHPSSAVGVFSFEYTRHFRSGVHYSECVKQSDNPDAWKLRTPYYFDVLSLQSKSLSGPGIDEVMDWEYHYGSYFTELCGNYGTPPSYPCSTNLQDKVVEVTRPDGSLQEHRFGIQYYRNDGRELELTTRGAGGDILNSKIFSYMSDSEAAQQPFHDEYGSDLGDISDPIQSRVRPVVRQTVAQQGSVFTHKTEDFDELARPNQVSRYSSHGAERNEARVYHDNLTKWVIGQVERVEVTGPETPAVVAKEVDYDPIWATPTLRKRFGRVEHVLDWNTSAGSEELGTLKSVTDGEGNPTQLSQWYRGVARQIEYADGTFVSADVNSDGTIASVRDERGYETCYKYDSMSRLEEIEYPSEALGGDCGTGEWNKTTQEFTQSTNPEFGLESGHWRQRIETGDGYKDTYFDALWRPVLVHEYDNQDSATKASTERFSRSDYDYNGKEIFSSYPRKTPSATSASPMIGVHTNYDALGRKTRIAEDSEFSDPLITEINYLYDAGGHYRQIVDPRGGITETWFLSFDEPAYDKPLFIKHPEDVYTVFSRDALGDVQWLGRGDDSARAHMQFQKRWMRSLRVNSSATRDYVYNANRELCKRVEPETGATIMAYDHAGNLTWIKEGSSYTNSSTCDTASVPPGDRIIRGYDGRNRIKSETFPDGRGNTEYEYWPDGGLRWVRVRDVQQSRDHSMVSSNEAWNYYDYNVRGMLESERLEIGPGSAAVQEVAAISYQYDWNGFRKSQVVSSENAFSSVEFAPNALGQSTRVGGFATDVSYWPNEKLKQFKYGNGVVHDLSLNERGFPDDAVDALGSTKIVALSYDYDGNGNVKAITDGSSEGGQQRNQDMEYDHLDRLTDASSPMFGALSYSYDELGNLVGVTSLNRGFSEDRLFCYDSTTNRLERTRSGSATIDFGYDSRGNMASQSGVTYDFDMDNRLRSASGQLTAIVYDGNGRRVLDRAPGKSGSSRLSVYTREGRLVYTYNQRNATEKFHHYLGSRLIVTDQISTKTGHREDRYHHTDSLASPVATTDEAARIIEATEYNPFGGVISRPLRDGVGFAGHVEDVQTGLNYMQQRYYSPAIGRFLSADPVNVKTRDASGFNRYFYAENNPYRFVDPDGRESREWAIARSKELVGYTPYEYDPGNPDGWNVVSFEAASAISADGLKLAELVQNGPTDEQKARALTVASMATGLGSAGAFAVHAVRLGAHLGRASTGATVSNFLMHPGAETGSSVVVDMVGGMKMLAAPPPYKAAVQFGNVIYDAALFVGSGFEDE